MLKQLLSYYSLVKDVTTLLTWEGWRDYLLSPPLFGVASPSSLPTLTVLAVDRKRNESMPYLFHPKKVSEIFLVVKTCIRYWTPGRFKCRQDTWPETEMYKRPSVFLLRVEEVRTRPPRPPFVIPLSSTPLLLGCRFSPSSRWQHPIRFLGVDNTNIRICRKFDQKSNSSMHSLLNQTRQPSTGGRCLNCHSATARERTPSPTGMTKNQNAKKRIYQKNSRFVRFSVNELGKHSAKWTSIYEQ